MDRRDRAEFVDPPRDEPNDPAAPATASRRRGTNSGRNRKDSGTPRQYVEPEQTTANIRTPAVGDRPRQRRDRTEYDASNGQPADGDVLEDLPPGDTRPAAGAPRRERTSGTGARTRRMAARPPLRASSFASRALPRGRSIQVSMPRSVQQSRLLRDQVAVLLLGTALFGLILFWITVLTQIGSLADTIVLRYDAEGLPALTGDARGLLRLPVLATFTVVMNLVVAWAVAEEDQFAARMVIAGTIMIQLLLWVAIILLVW